MNNVSVTKPYQKRRRFSPEFKANIVAECLEPGASVSRISLENGLNTNMVRRWINEARPAPKKSGFVSVALPAATSAPSNPSVSGQRNTIRIEIPRTLIHRSPENTQCRCGCQLKRIGEDVSEKLDYVPGEFTVERHVRGKWACAKCETLIQAPVPPQIIDKGISTAGLLVQVLVAKYADHLPLYRQERIFGRAGLETPRSTLAEWVGACGVQLQPLADALRNTLLEHNVLHADETPVSMLAPGKKKTHKAYVWAYCTTPFSNLKATFMTSLPAVQANTPAPSWVTGRASWCVTTTLAARPGSATASPRSVVWLTPGASSTTCTKPTRVNWLPRPWSTSAGSTKSSGKPKTCHRTNGRRSGRRKPGPLLMRCISGCWRTARKCRMAPAPPKHWITASNGGKR